MVLVSGVGDVLHGVVQDVDVAARAAIQEASGQVRVSASSAAEDLLHTWIGSPNVPDRHTTVLAVIEFSLLAIHEFTSADVLPLAEENVTVHERGAPIGTPDGLRGFGIRPSPSAGAVPSGSIGNALAVTGGGGWVTWPGRTVAATKVVAELAARMKTVRTATRRCEVCMPSMLLAALLSVLPRKRLASLGAARFRTAGTRGNVLLPRGWCLAASRSPCG
jgi:hypothetical protein